MVYQRVLSSLGIHRSSDEIRAALAKTEEQFKKDKSMVFGKAPFKEYWTEYDSAVLEHLGVPATSKLASEIQARWYDCVDCEIYSDVKETLEKLKHMGLKIGLVSTGYEEDIVAITRKANIEMDMFDVIVGANTVKEVKPHPNVFKHALQKLRVKPVETLFVGDNVDADYKGAEKAGMRALLIQRTENKQDTSSGLKTITSLKEIFRFID